MGMNPICTWYDDCFALHSGRRKILKSTKFKKDCPFYKTAEQVQNEQGDEDK